MVALVQEQTLRPEEKLQTGSKLMQRVVVDVMRNITARLKMTIEGIMLSSGKKYPQLFPKVSLDRLESIEENVYKPCTYCKYDPKSGNGGGAKSSGSNRGSQGNGSRKKNGGRNRPRSSGGRPSSKGSRGSNSYQSDIAKGKIPGQAGKDYPNYSLSSLNKKGNFKGIKAAPQDKIPKNYPRNSGGGGGKRAQGSNRGGNRGGSNGKRNGGSGGGGDCPGSLDDCMAACPASLKVFKACTNACARRCGKK
eukprot:TRINITY_DN32037_c0_g1_i1.p1 TRINITY_DN32037_c0_g1~~TRINITY_DN32037_c0_g1_i1.p1  ORF type:complete len:250 (-),score=48.94 TRINITY_DN32037_c0_g1_i1:226-975(-)